MIRIARMPGYIRDGDLTLRRITILDGSSLRAMFQNKDAARSDGTERPASESCISYWWRVRKTFPLAYRIECEAKRIGFIGLYDLVLREYGRMSLAISDKNLRQKGYGGRAAGILMDKLKKHRFVRTVIVEVEEDNNGSLAFWRKIGFGETQRLPGKTVMTLDILNPHGP